MEVYGFCINRQEPLESIETAYVPVSQDSAETKEMTYKQFAVYLQKQLIKRGYEVSLSKKAMTEPTYFVKVDFSKPIYNLEIRKKDLTAFTPDEYVDLMWIIGDYLGGGIYDFNGILFH